VAENDDDAAVAEVAEDSGMLCSIPVVAVEAGKIDRRRIMLVGRM
jgi:hypothetical protein